MSATVKASANLIAKFTLIFSAHPCDFPAPCPACNPQIPTADLVCAILVAADTTDHLGATGGTATGSKLKRVQALQGAEG